MTISIENLLSILGLGAGIITIFVKSQVDNAVHKQSSLNNKEKIDSLEKRISDHENKIEGKIDEMIKMIQDLFKEVNKKTK